MVVKAIYQNGVFKPVAPVDLRDGEWVDLEILRPTPEPGRKTVSLRGVWKDGLRPEDQGDWVTETIAELRGDYTHKLDQLARKPSEDLARRRHPRYSWRRKPYSGADPHPGAAQ